MRDAGVCGVLFAHETCARVEGCRIHGRHTNGVQAGDAADPFVTGNSVAGALGSGVMLHGRARGFFSLNTVQGSCLAGVGVRDSAAPVFVENR